MKEEARTKVKHFRNRNFKPSKNLCTKIFYVHEQILRARNCRRKFIKNLLPEKRKENM